MSEPSPIPPGALMAAGALIAVTLILAAVGRVTGIGTLRTPDADVVRTIELRFLDSEDGGVTVLHADDERVLARLAPGTNGFIRGVMRSLVRARRIDHIEADPPFRLTLWSDHRLTLSDPATGQSLDLSGFGQDNRAAFAKLLAVNAAQTRDPLTSTLAPGRAAP